VAVTGRYEVVELRQYRLVPGRRDALIELFDGELVDPQEAAGMCVLGQFRDVDRPDMFVWLRAFPDMARRRAALQAFYGGPVWRAHRDAANATMIDSDDVLLLRPAPGPLWMEAPPRLLASDTSVDSSAVYGVTVCSLGEPADQSVSGRNLLAGLSAISPRPVAVFVEEPSENSFPALPVREGEHVVVWVQRADSQEVLGPRLEASLELAESALLSPVPAAVQLRLSPTSRSRLR
jgi:hypothetical protein